MTMIMDRKLVKVFMIQHVVLVVYFLTASIT